MTAHTTGGGATDLLLDAYEAANGDQPIAPRRFTVTHGNFPDRRAIERARAMGVAFDSQPAWLHFDGAAIKNAFGPARMRDFLPLRSLIKAGVPVVVERAMYSDADGVQWAAGTNAVATRLP